MGQGCIHFPWRWRGKGGKMFQTNRLCPRHTYPLKNSVLCDSVCSELSWQVPSPSLPRKPPPGVLSPLSQFHFWIITAPCVLSPLHTHIPFLESPRIMYTEVERRFCCTSGTTKEFYVFLFRCLCHLAPPPVDSVCISACTQPLKSRLAEEFTLASEILKVSFG